MHRGAQSCRLRNVPLSALIPLMAPHVTVLKGWEELGGWKASAGCSGLDRGYKNWNFSWRTLYLHLRGWGLGEELALTLARTMAGSRCKLTSLSPSPALPLSSVVGEPHGLFASRFMLWNVTASIISQRAVLLW